MINRFGKRVDVAYPEHHLLWLEAANQMQPYERSQALYDIADLTGRHVSTVREKANKMRREATLQAEALRKLADAKSYEWRLVGSTLVVCGKIGMEPRKIANPDKRRLMGCK